MVSPTRPLANGAGKSSKALSTRPERNDPPTETRVFRDGNRIAGIRFGDTLRSVRTTSGIHYASNSILWAEAVLLQAQRSGIKTLEVAIPDRRGSTRIFRAPLAVMLERGELRYTSAGVQRGLKLHAWAVDGIQPKPEPECAQLDLFSEVAR